MADDVARERYRRAVAAEPELFASEPGGIRIVLDEGEIAGIEAVMGERMAAKGMPRDWATVGLCYEDPYLRLLRDAVVFPDGSPGIHHRVIYRATKDAPGGVAVLPVLDGKAVLIRHYRHAIGGWSWEAPRGGSMPGKTPEEAVRIELEEEIGAVAGDVVELGRLHSSTALIRAPATLFFARLESLGTPCVGEGILEIRLVTSAELEAMILSDQIRDSFTVALFTHARLRGLL